MTTGRRVTSEKLSELLEITACYKFPLRNDGRWKVESRHFEMDLLKLIIINKQTTESRVYTYNVFLKKKS
jgi:hypothetical protein